MKRSLSVCLILAFVISIVSFRDSGELVKNANKIEISFTSKLNFNDIVKIKLDLSEKGIILNYKKLNFDDYGKLEYISFFVDCKDGFSGAASSDLNNQSRFGFFRDYSENAISPFGTGGLNAKTSK